MEMPQGGYREPPIVGLMLIRVPIETVFDYVTTPGTWPKWYPVTRAVTGATDHSVKPGEEWREEVKLPAWSGYFYWQALSSERPHGFRYQGYARKKGGLWPQLSSGGTAVITYTFSEVGGGTLFQRVLEYKSPNRLMVLFDKLAFHNAVVKASSAALLKMKENLESSSGES